MQRIICPEPKTRILPIHAYLVKYSLKEQSALHTVPKWSYCAVAAGRIVQTGSQCEKTVDLVDFHFHIQCAGFHIVQSDTLLHCSAWLLNNKSNFLLNLKLWWTQLSLMHFLFFIMQAVHLNNIIFFLHTGILHNALGKRFLFHNLTFHLNSTYLGCLVLLQSWCEPIELPEQLSNCYKHIQHERLCECNAKASV